MILEFYTGFTLRAHPVLLTEQSIEVDVAHAMREVARDHTAQLTRLTMTRLEWDVMMDEWPHYQGRDIDRIMGLPVCIVEDRPGRRWPEQPPLTSEQERRLTTEITSPFIFRDTPAEAINDMMVFGTGYLRMRTADDIYRVHGGSQTPPSKRPPSKLHPLVMQDEADRKALSDGATSAAPRSAAPGDISAA